MKEKDLQSRLVANRGKLLQRIDKDLVYVDQEYVVPGGRIDILALKKGLPVGIELKAKSYNTNNVCGQLLKYAAHFDQLGGQVYFVAPEITTGVRTSFQYDSRVQLYTFDNSLRFRKKGKRIALPQPRSAVQKYVAAPLSRFISKKLLGL